MLKLVLVLTVLALLAVAYAGHAGGGGGGGGHSPHGGWGGWGKKYHGWANVKAWNGPWSSQYSLDEHGSGYNRYAWLQQEFGKGHHGK
ncbi:neuropeptide-like protein 33 [Folsomia candida]|uniref:neuropeptide-like protein 33 n=1 Tax=Folsomia candida TaxID=158441 RepID=UPI000B9073DA|nr:neuropeptide-like protein 33 [Folsomia candida]